MIQYANLEICGIVSDLKMNHEKKSFTVLINVNQSDAYGYHTGKKQYFVNVFDTAYTVLQPYIQVGDTIVIRKAELNVNYEKRMTFISVKESAYVFLIHKENRSNLLARQNQNAVSFDNKDLDHVK